MNNIMESLDKLQFFGGQRAGRELWADKPEDVQNVDIESFNSNIEFIRIYIQQLEAKCHQLERERERDAAVAEFELADCPCDFCQHLKKYASDEPCSSCKYVLRGEESRFEWRGAKEE